MENGFCRTFEYDRLRTKRYVSVANHITTAVKKGGSLYFFGKKSALEFEIRPGHNPDRLRDVRISTAHKEGAGLAGEGGIVVKHKGRKTHGDTLVAYDPETLEEVIRQPFPGKVRVIDMAPDGVIVQMAGGMIMRISRRETEYSTYEAGWIPFISTESARSGGIVSLVSEEEQLYSFELKSLVPEPIVEGGAAIVPIGTGAPPERPKEKKEKD
jgi:hypothetical protein